jgi:negative regulator of flagellin synthesis FlgM
MFVMIDPIKTGRTTPVTLSTGRGGVARGSPSAASALVQHPDGAPSLAQSVRDLASRPAPVAAERVNSIRAAIAEGRFPVDPVRIAAAMLIADEPA